MPAKIPPSPRMASPSSPMAQPTTASWTRSEVQPNGMHGAPAEVNIDGAMTRVEHDRRVEEAMRPLNRTIM
eukprot:34976-Lingulodinium_polyedra.AAC.1